ncbi:MAG: hypothetical protein RLZZ299_1712 [Pseudomonadota bacterium]
MVVAPIVMGTLLVGGTAGWFWTVERTEGTASGPPMRLRVEAGCAEGAEAVRRRARELGILEPSSGGGAVSSVELTVRAPGMPDDRTHLPAMLAAPGRLALSRRGSPVEVAIANVGVQLAFSGTPITLVVAEEPLPPAEELVATMDGTPMEIEAVNGVELQLASRAGDSRTALRGASDRAVQLRHPLRCPVRVEVLP